jgi:hypothetical protein
MKLNLGCGNAPLEGYENLDRSNGKEAFPLTGIADGSVDEVRASHILEHFPHEQTRDVLKEWVRVLKPGGVLKIAVPDFYKLAELYLKGENIPIQNILMGGHKDANDHHGAIFDAESLEVVMREAGLKDVRFWASDAKDCSSYPFSLNLMGTKSAPISVAIRCAMSVPTLGFQSNFFCWAQALAPLGINPTKYDGAFWGQCLERTMTGMVDTCDFILTLDYDSAFTKNNVIDLIHLITSHPEADAVAAMQLKRGDNMPLFTMRDGEDKIVTRISSDDLNVPLLKVATAHFGLTLIRCSALKTMPHPWFWGQPNQSGMWEGDRTDDDIYFWHKWQEQGKSVYLAPKTVIGHGSYMLCFPDMNMKPTWQSATDFYKSGPPDNVWK